MEDPTAASSKGLDLQPTLRGELVELRPLRAEDWGALFGVASDPLIWEQHPVRDRYTETVFRAFFRHAMESRGAFVIIERSTGRIIGSTRYHAYDADRCDIEIGWTFLARQYWGGGYNAEAKHLMLDHAFQSVDRVYLDVGVDNLRSRRAVEKLGAVAQREIDVTDDVGRVWPHIRYMITSPGWFSRSPGDHS